MNSSLSISAVTAKNENTLALAAMNFNFSLITVEPPAEYKKLGQLLSSKRRTAAEEGSVHMTARKLGALFEQVAKPSEALIKAYGVRSSEISASPDANPTGSDRYGFLRDQIGADGTTIWAAATSGKSAMAMNLLACFLARLWSQPEAVSIWVELVECRKKEIRDTMDGSEPAHLAPMEAARQTIRREELAEWDAGARAWLRAGDVVKKREMKQLSLIVDNLNLPVDNCPLLYTSVIKAWKTAMDTVGKLITGMSHRVQNGAVLLAVSAWHIYPDMVVLSNTEKHVSQRDPLIPSDAYITIGFQNTSGSDEAGVNWSLSLARLRYYGPPVPSTRSTGEAERLSLSQFLFVFLGIFLASWQDITTDWLLAAELITTIWEYISAEAASTNNGANKGKEFVKDQSTWIALLYQAARALLDSTGMEHEEALRLVKTGTRRRCCRFLGGSHHPAFGLTKFSNYITVLREEERVLVLGNIATADGGIYRNFGNRANHKTSPPNPPSNFEGGKPKANSPLNFRDTAPLDTESGPIATRNAPSTNRVTNNSDIQTRSSWTSYLYRLVPKFQIEPRRRHPSLESSSIHFPRSIEGTSYSSSNYYERIIEDHVITSELVEKCGLASRHMAISEVIMAINSKKADAEQLLRHIKWTYLHAEENYVTSLKLVASAAMVYRLLPNATISIQVFQKPLYLSRWASGIRPSVTPEDPFSFCLKPYGLSRSRAFGCVAMFETGSLSLDWDLLTDVMAMSIGDSIYVSAPLLCDPSETTEDYELKRVIGNIGRAGVALMIPPINPQMKMPTLENWKQINHYDYDGKAQDSFQGTSLHLSFTGYDRPVSYPMLHGAQGVEANFVEAVVSVLDRGQWVGDIDLLKVLEARSFFRLKHCRDRGHVPGPVPPFKICSIDHWDELLERPQHICGIVRANGNWLARLASTALSIQSLNITYLVPKGGELCWKCYEEVDLVPGNIIVY